MLKSDRGLPSRVTPGKEKVNEMKVCLMEVDERTKQSISLVFKHRTGDAIVIAGEDVSDIAVIDLDNVEALKTYRAARERKPELRAIGLASTLDIEYRDVLVLCKPISAGRLLDAIQQVSGKDLQVPMIKAAGVASSLSERTRSAKRRPETAVPAEANACFDPEAYLMGTILNAGEEARRADLAAVISLHGGWIIVLDPQSKMIQTNCSQARMLSLFASGAKAREDSPAADGYKPPVVEYMARDQVMSKYAGKTYGIPKEQLMWKLGWVTSQGRLPLGVDVEQRLYLQRWPNMTLFAYSADEMRIVAYWMRQAASLREIAEALDIPLQEVCSVYTSAFAAGLVGVGRREADAVWQVPEVTEHKERGLFASIMKRLMQRKPAANEDAGMGEAIAA
jgi:hypothetical protein